MPKAIYPGSFDPITYGHLDIIERAEKIFDDLIVGVVENPRKETLFSPQTRKELVEEATSEEGINVSRVITFSGLLVNCAKKYNRKSIVRGLRANSDFEYEFQMALTNRDLAPEIESVFLMTSGEYSFLSSSIVKEVKGLGGDVSSFVPQVVERRLVEKFDLK
ncbi:pantetheine-phosphate adenylyltransferase [Candidatus Bipolaricaulota bacterium]|nr:pantetheine-phosphate adenylyltransferase [Candidatus Bipolaricaulota bacterium]